MDTKPLSKPHLLVVDDEISMCEFLQIMLRKEGFKVTTFNDPEKALQTLEKEWFDLVLTDMSMPGVNGLELLRKVKARSPETAVIIMTAFGTTETAIEAMKSGAFDYITKPFNNEAIKLTILKCLQTTRLERENVALKRQMKLENRFGQIIGSSPSMNEVFELIQVVRNNKSNVLITGESGVGKELVAREIHFNGELANRPFITVNCGAIPDNLVESELFGHARGAFTGAISNHRGLFRAADGGTIFLDEIGELPAQTQVKLLRVLQNKIIRPVGSTDDHPVDVRIIAATNQDLESLVKKGSFREDLYFRLNVIHIRVPPLRERREDIAPLANFFLRKASQDLGKEVVRFSQEALDRLQSYAFPGNIRELENIVERSLALERTTVLLPESLPEHLRDQPAGAVSGPAASTLPDEGFDLEAHLDAIERAFLEKALAQAGGTKTDAAKLLKLTFRSFRYRLQKHGLE